MIQIIHTKIQMQKQINYSNKDNENGDYGGTNTTTKTTTSSSNSINSINASVVCVHGKCADVGGNNYDEING